MSVCTNTEKLIQTQHEYGIEDVNVYYLSEGEFVMPGFVDTHIHAPQYPNAGLGYDKQLLDWLTTYTFPLEKKYVDVDFAIGVYESVVVSPLLPLSCKFPACDCLQLAHISEAIPQTIHCDHDD